MEGLIGYVLRNARLGDCTNRGITSRVDTVTVIDRDAREVFAPAADRPAVKLVRRAIAGKPYIHAEPIKQPVGVVGPMFGGNYIECREVAPYPIPMHDRFETQAQYDALSR